MELKEVKFSLFGGLLSHTRVGELRDFEESDSDSDSEEDQDNSTDENLDSLSLIRRDLYLGLLFLLLLIVLQNYWVRNTCLRN